MAKHKPQLARPEKKEIVTDAILRIVGLNVQAFSGERNPSTLYRLMTDGTASVFPFYRELEEKDTAIESALSTRRALVLARKADIQSADAKNGQAQRYADEAAAFLDSIPNWNFALWELLDAPAYGYAVAEILWNNEAGRVGVEKIVGRPQEIFRFGKTFDPQVGPLLLAPSGINFQPVPPAKFLVSTYQPRHGDRRGRPVLRRVFWPSWFKRNILRLHLKFLEKGNGTVVVKYGRGAEDEEKAKALEAAEAIADELFLAVPEDFELMEKALQNSRTRDGNDFRTFVDYLDAEMTRLILSQTLTTRGAEQQHGTLSLGEVHMDILFELIRQDAGDLETVINEQLLGPWLLWTFGDQALERAVRPWWTIDKQPPKDLSRQADLLAKGKALGVEIAVTEAREKLQLRAPEEGEEVLPASSMPPDLMGSPL